MKEITFEDMLLHYELKLRESSEYLYNAVRLMKKSVSVSESGWRGGAAEACRSRLGEIIEDAGKIQGNISEAMVLLSEIGGLVSCGEGESV